MKWNKYLKRENVKLHPRNRRAESQTNLDQWQRTPHKKIKAYGVSVL